MSVCLLRDRQTDMLLMSYHEESCSLQPSVSVHSAVGWAGNQFVTIQAAELTFEQQSNCSYN